MKKTQGNTTENISLIVSMKEISTSKFNDQNPMGA